MRVAVISDLHGNFRALEAVLADIERRGADQIVCAGDIVNPFLRSAETWQKLKELGIPCIRGNHEDYMAAYHDPELRPEVRDSVHFLPTRIVAQHLGAEITGELSALPFSRVIGGPGGDDLYVSHASPLHNSRSPWLGIPDDMASAIRKVPQSTLVSGHMHTQWTLEWEGKLLVIAGSVGLPLSGTPKPAYSILEHRGGRWQVLPFSVDYDQQGALREFRESGCLENGGPIAWMLYDELATAQPRLAHFLPRMHQRPQGRPELRADWENEARSYLEELGRWETVRQALS